MPIANDLRPKELKDFVGQSHVISPESWLFGAIKSDNLSSMILFGPPGSGKTTLASIIANATKSRFIHLNATTGSAKKLKEELEIAEELFKNLAARFPWWAEWLGPIVWGLSLGWLAIDLQGSANRKTIPVLLYLGIVGLRDGPEDGEAFWNEPAEI